MWFVPVSNGQTFDAAFYGLQSFTFPTVHPPMVYFHCFYGRVPGDVSCSIFHVISFFQCLKLPAHDRRRQHAESSMNCITEMFQISEAVLCLWKMMCIFRHVLASDRFHTVFISHAHNGYIMVGLQRNYVWYSKVETMQHWSWILYAVFVFVMWLRINAENAVSSKAWDLNVQQEKNVQSILIKSIYVESFVPEMTHAP